MFTLTNTIGQYPEPDPDAPEPGPDDPPPELIYPAYEVVSASYDPDGRAWRCVGADGAAFNISDFDGSQYVLSGEPPEPPVTDPETTLTVDVPTFKMRFTPAELLAIRASEDPTVKAFLSEILDDPRTTRVNIGLAFVQGAVGYMAGVVNLGSGLLDPPLIQPERVSVILAPQPI